jgi:murein DD-endopeptidase MepM/ murein hydrolase activator NlpD
MMLVLLLALVSAAVGAGVAFLARPSDDALPATSQVAVVATTRPESGAQEDHAQQPVTRAEVVEQSANEEPQPTTEAQELSEPPVTAEPADQANTGQAAGDLAEQGSSQQGAAEQVLADRQEPEVDAEPRVVATTTPDLVTQGEAFSVVVESDEASAVVATIGDTSWNLIELNGDTWWAVVAVPRDAPTGSYEIVIDIYGDGGSWLRSLNASYIVLANAAPFEEIILGGTGTPADPAAIQRDVAVRFHEHTAVTGPPRWDGPWIAPAAGEVSGVFGALRSYDGVESDEWHHGHDIAAQHGDPIVAPAPGTVVWTGEIVLHGMGVIIDHGAGVYSGYWHMSLIAVREGVEVLPGDWIGNIGTTGLSTGPHLHWEVIIRGIDVDPVQWMGDDIPQLPLLPPASAESEQTADTLE